MAPGTKSNIVSLFVQARTLRDTFPESKTRIIRGSKLIWEGKLTPTPLSETYDVRVIYDLKVPLEIEILQPQLQKRNGDRCEHMYADNKPCLYWPDAGEWQRNMFLVKTIIPWTCEWLAHYEVWLVTGKWHGGGIHPGDE